MCGCRTFISLICLCAITANPLLAATAPCCCSKQLPQKPSCCPTTSEQKATATAPHQCCHKPTSEPKVQLKACPCCVKSVPQSSPAKEASSRVTVAPAIILWPADQAVPFTLNEVGQRLTKISLRPTGIALLALYCRWLE